jgi:uncharacterized integral membrane protein (TIGR00698 family)
MHTNLRTAAFALPAILCLIPAVSPGLALGGGIGLALVVGNPMGRSAGKISRWLLQASVVLLGFGMNLTFLLRAGIGGAGFAAGTILLTLTAGYVLGRSLHIRRPASMLISAGTAICGGSAIAAVGPTIGADEADMAVALGSVFLLNAVALYLFPVLGHAMHLTDQQFGLWAGVSIHDISSVVGAAARYSPAALSTATAVKLSRSLWIVPVTLVMAMVVRRNGNRTDRVGRMAPVPWFIGLFVLASVLRSIVPGITPMVAAMSHMATRGLTLALFLMGASLSMKTLQTVGWKAIVQAAALWVLISGVSLAVIVRM